MVKTEARKRMHRIEENHMDKFKDKKTREDFIDKIFKQMDEKHKKANQISEEQLKDQLARMFK